MPDATPLRPCDCPACGQPWRYNWTLAPGDPFKVVCGKCKTVLPNEQFPEDKTEEITDRTGQKQVWKFHEKNGYKHRLTQLASFNRMTQFSDLSDIGLAYALTGRREYAETARRMLLAAAEDYPKWLYHDWFNFMDKPKGIAGKISGWRLQDASFGMACMTAYDMIRDSGVLSDEEKATIEKNIFAELAYLLTTKEGGEGGNADGEILSAVAYIGVLTNDHDLVAYAVEAPRYRGIVNRDFMRDGSWWEGSFSYSYMMLDAMAQLPEIVRGYSDPASYTGTDAYRNLDLYTDPRLESIYTLASRAVVLDGKLPPTNDSHVTTALRPLLGEIAMTRYGQENNILPLILAYNGDPGSQGDRYALFHRDPAISFDIADPKPLTSTNLPGYGAGILRSRGASGRPVPRNDAALVLDYGPHGGGHGHNDKLNIMTYGFGEELAMDLGYVHAGYEKRPWMVFSLSHNLVVVDEKNQTRTTGSLELFASTPMAEIAAASAPAAYPGVEDYWRLNALVNASEGRPNYIVDAFYVKGGKTHDWAYHTEGGLVQLSDDKGTSIALAPFDKSVWAKNGMYRWLDNIREGRAVGEIVSEWRNGEVRNITRLVGAPDTTVLLAKMPGQRIHALQYFDRPLDKLIVRRTPADGASFFLAIHEPVAPGAEPMITSVRLNGGDPAKGAALLEVTFAGGGRDTIAIDRGGNETFRLSDGRRTVRTGRVEGRIAASDAAARNVEFEGPALPEGVDLAGAFLRAPSVDPGGYTIAEAVPATPGRIRLQLEDVQTGALAPLTPATLVYTSEGAGATR